MRKVHLDLGGVESNDLFKDFVEQGGTLGKSERGIVAEWLDSERAVMS
jgi:hypothetical protein